MSRLFSFRYTAFALILMLSVFLAACGDDGGDDADASDEEETSEESDDGAEDQELEIGQEELTEPYVAWAREEISTHMLSALLEKVGYSVDTKQVEAGPMFSSVAEGDADFQTSTWLPSTHKSYWDKYEDDLVKVNQTLDKAPLALTVPDYVDEVDSMEDLKDNEEFGEAVDWTITGIDPGAGIMQNTEKALDEYGLDNWELTTSSESAMLAELQEAIDNEEPILVPLWKPHWAFGVMDLKMLDDSKEIYGGDGDQIFTVARNNLEEDAPRAYKVMEQYDESYEMLEEMMPKVHDEGQDVEKVVDEFLENNPDKVDEWLDGVPRED